MVALHPNSTGIVFALPGKACLLYWATERTGARCGGCDVLRTFIYPLPVTLGNSTVRVRVARR